MKLLSSKIFAANVILIILFTILILFFSFQTIRTHYLNTFNQDLINLNTTLIYQITPLIEEKKYDELNVLINKIGSRINARLTVVAVSGDVLADSKFDPKRMENHLNRLEIQHAFKQDSSIVVRNSPTLHKDMVYVAMPIYSNGKIIAISRASIFLKDVDKLTKAITNDIIQIAFIIIIIALVFVLIFSRNVTKPVLNLSQASRKVALGDFDVKVPVKGNDEINELSENFNNMTLKLKELFDLVLSQKEEYYSLISSIQEGLLLIDSEGKVILSNHSFNKIIDKSDIINLNYKDLISNVYLEDLINSLSKENISILDEIDLNNNHYICSINLVEKKNEIVILFHDITENKKLEKIKKDFVTNVSHELRTPLTAIKGYIETLEDEFEGDNLHYIEIIKRHTDRLVNIVQDLLLLSELEELSTQLMISRIDIRVLFENLYKVFVPKLDEKKLYLKIEFTDDFPKLEVDPFRFEQVFINLIDNAIKYTDLGGITVLFKAENGKAIIIIEDTGVGISKEHHNRIFERFYIVDKSRSRKVGGTGLGLSIVKHIIMLHHGDIIIDSDNGKGTKFIITLPLNQIVKKGRKKNN